MHGLAHQVAGLMRVTGVGQQTALMTALVLNLPRIPRTLFQERDDVKAIYSLEITEAAGVANLPNLEPYGCGPIEFVRTKLCTTTLSLQVVSSHLLGALGIESVLSIQRALVDRLLPHASNEAEALKHPNFPRLFLLDGCSITLPLGPLSSRLRANSPGSKFLALLAPDRSGEAEMIRLIHWGIDGMLVLDEDWKSSLPKAVVALLANQLWIPRQVLLEYVKRMRILLDRQLLPGQPLTRREGQVLQLLFRRLTNKEIACDLNITERTAKFHVCNVLNKLGLENRKNLLETFLLKSL